MAVRVVRLGSPRAASVTLALDRRLLDERGAQVAWRPGVCPERTSPCRARSSS